MAENDQKTSDVPEDSRFGLLKDALDQASDKIVKKILSQKAFSDSLPFMKKKPETLTQLHSTFCQKVQSRLREDIDELVSGLCLKEKLDFLDKLDTEQAELSQGETVWRPTGDPSKDMLAYDVPCLQSHKEELLSLLAELHADNEHEKKKILNVVEDINETERTIEGLLAKNEKGLQILSSIPSL